MARTFTLTQEIVNAHAPIACLSARAIGGSFRLYSKRPGPERNTRLDVPGEDGAPLELGAREVDGTPKLLRVDIRGVLEQRAMQHDPSGSWTDGHDAIADRLCAAFELGDVCLYIDSPGGAHAGLQQNIERAAKAKAQFDRRVTVYADEMIGSAAYWWAIGVGDEIFAPISGQLGSIGARGGHLSVAGAMAQAGLVQTYFEDPPGKTTFAPEKVLSDEGMRRGQRDVTIAADAFRAAVYAARGIPPETLIALGADMLTGQAAVDARLADGISSIDDVIEYALSLTSRNVSEAAAIAAA